MIELINLLTSHRNWDRIENIDLICDNCTELIKTIDKDNIFNIFEDVCPKCGELIIKDQEECLESLLSYLNDVGDDEDIKQI